jgi:hypothetical protein
MRKINHIASVKQAGVDKQRFKEFITVIILSENHGYRMKSYGSMPLIKIKDKTLLEKQVEVIKSTFLNYEIILCAGFEVKKIKEFVKKNLSHENIRIIENQVHYNSNCCESARLCLNNTMNNKILFLSGGLFLNPEFLSSIDFNSSSIVVQNENPTKNFEISGIFNRERLASLCLGEKKDFWTESVFLRGDETVEKFYNIISNPDFKNKFLFEAINELNRVNQISVNKNIGAPVLKINNLKSLRETNK